MRSHILVATFICATAATAAVADAPVPLGRIDFPTTGPKPAQQHFLRGMLAMHSFWYEEARDQFRAATAAAPTFAMGYWGEALTYYHPVWHEENLVGSRAAMAKIPSSAPLSQRERGLIAAANALFGDGDRDTRWRTYAAALRKLHEDFPDDDEVTTLCSAAILGTAKRGEGFRPFAEAAALSLAVLQHNPDHPGAAHYVIHALDDPEHAILALPAALRYAQIAPEAYHAQHMPSHIFVQLGMWPQAQASNEAAWAASVAAATKKQLDTSYYDFHSLSWLLSISLERGQRHRAEEQLARARDALARSHDADRMPLVLGTMAVDYMQTTDDWSHLDDWLAPLATVESSVASSPTRLNTPGCAQHLAATVKRVGLEAQALLAFARGEAAATAKDAARLIASRKALAAVTTQMQKEASDDWRTAALALEARLDELRHQPAPAIAALRKAIDVDEKTPPSGPAGAITPRERLGELLLRQHRPAEALVEFRRSLELHPRRTRSLLGAARAAGAADREAARDYYAQLVSNWADADAQTPGLDDARAAVQSR